MYAKLDTACDGKSKSRISLPCRERLPFITRWAKCAGGFPAVAYPLPNRGVSDRAARLHHGYEMRFVWHGKAGLHLRRKWIGGQPRMVLVDNLRVADKHE